MFGLKALKNENDALRNELAEMREMLKAMRKQIEDVDAVVEAKVNNALADLDLSNDIESAVYEVMRNARVSIDL